MKYFCSRCQARYDIGDIAVNFHEICIKKIIDNLKTLSLQWDYSLKNSREFFKLLDFLQNGSKNHLEKFFAIKGNDAKNILKNPAWNGLVLTGRLVISFKQLIDFYKQSPVWETDRENGFTNPSELFKKDINSTVYDEYVKFVFGEIGKNKELILDHVTDSKNDPSFEEKAEMLYGFKRCCPHCGRPLAAAVGRAPEIVIALSGIPRAGKTSNLTAIASALRSGRYSQYGLSLEIFNNDEQWNALSQQLDKYDRGIRVDKTEEKREAFSYSFLAKFGNSKRVLTFVDMPGEFWQDESGNGLKAEFFSQYSGIYNNIDCIWFFISKLTAYGFDFGEENTRTDIQRKLLIESNERPDVAKKERPENLYANLSMLKDLLTSSGHKMPPCAIILTKTEINMSDKDAVKDYNLFPTESGEIATSPAAIASTNATELKKVFVSNNAGGYHLNEREFFSLSLKTRNFLIKYSTPIVEAIENNLNRRFYIASASYGHAAHDEDSPVMIAEKPYPPTPYHEMFPVLWTLAITSAIPVSHPCIWNEKNIFGSFKRSTEGDVDIRFNAQAYINDRIQTTGNSESDEDLKKLNSDLARNLLMEPDELGKVSFKQTTFNHKRSK